MENHHRHKTTSSGDNFTFPAMSPDIEKDSELADHLFSNGKFLLHTFPLQPGSLTSCNFSRTCSVSSKDSLVSSRSTSTNSRSSSSSCSSARTSTSEGSTAGVTTRTASYTGNGSRSPVHHTNNYYLPAQRWQFMAPVPVLNRRSSSQRRKAEYAEYEKQNRSPEMKKYCRKKGYCRRFFMWLVSTCKECHAMEPSKKVF